MADYRGDGRKKLTEAIREQDPGRKVDALIEALLLHFVELEHVMEHLGAENFDDVGLRDLNKKLEKLRRDA